MTENDGNSLSAIVERFRIEGWNFVLQCENGGRWFACWSDTGQLTPHVSIEAHGDTASEAVRNLSVAARAAGKLPR